MRTFMLMVPSLAWLRHFGAREVYLWDIMGTFYRDKRREFNGRCLVLCVFEYTWARERAQDTIMISVDCSDQIMGEFAKHCKILEKKDPALLFYIPECNKPTFDYRSVHAS